MSNNNSFIKKLFKYPIKLILFILPWFILFSLLFASKLMFNTISSSLTERANRTGVKIQAPSSGIIEKVHKKPGDNVLEGELIVEYKLTDSQKTQLEEDEKKAVKAPVNIFIMSVHKKRYEDYLILPGLLRPYEEITIFPQAHGRILSCKFENGMTIEAGDTLIQIDPIDAELNLKTATAQVEIAKYQFQAAKKGARSEELEALEKTMRQAEDSMKLSKETFQRIEKLYQKSAASKQNYDEAHFAFKGAENNYFALRARYNLALAGTRNEELQASKSNLDLAISNLEKAKLAVKRCTVTAPVSGIISAKTVSEGMLIDDKTPIAKISDIRQFRLTIGIPEKDILSVQECSEIDVVIDSADFKTRITKIHSFNLESSPIAKVYPVELLISNTNGKLLPNMIAKTNAIRKILKNSIVVPLFSVLPSGEEHYVFIEKDGKAIKRKVTLGEIFTTDVEIIDGLEENDNLIIYGQKILGENDPVLIVRTVENYRELINGNQ